MKSFSNWDIKDVQQHNLRVASGKSGPVADSHSATARVPGQTATAPKRFSQRTKPLLNKLETEWFNRIRFAFPNYPAIRAQAKTYVLGNGVRYSPDFTCSCWPDHDNPGPSRETAWEVKGPWATDDAIVKLKMAAEVWPEVRWIMAWKDKAGAWHTQEAKPHMMPTNKPHCVD